MSVLETVGRMAPTELLTQLITVTAQCVTTVAEERTKWEKIRAHRDVLIRAIEAETALFSGYIDRTFAERRSMLEEHFRLVDTALERQDSRLMEQALTGVWNVLHTSPFTGFKEFRAAAQRGDVIEF